MKFKSIFWAPPSYKLQPQKLLSEKLFTKRKYFLLYWSLRSNLLGEKIEKILFIIRPLRKLLTYACAWVKVKRIKLSPIENWKESQDFLSRNNHIIIETWEFSRYIPDGRWVYHGHIHAKKTFAFWFFAQIWGNSTTSVYFIQKIFNAKYVPCYSKKRKRDSSSRN